MKKYLILLFSFLLLACGKAKNSDIPIVNLILDTDMGPDYDDVGAMTLMYALADSGQVNILATLSSNKDEQAIPCIEVINEYFERSNIPVGAPKNIAPSLTTWHKESKWTDYPVISNIRLTKHRMRRMQSKFTDKYSASNKTQALLFVPSDFSVT